MTQEEIKQAASEYNHKRFKANGMMDTKMSYEIFMAFVAGANCALQHQITEDNAWRIYNFVWAWKHGRFGEISLQDALNEHYNEEEWKEV